LQSITHEDGTARIQTITREQNAFMYDLLTQMQKIELTPVLLNTSFNTNGKPILNTYKEAFDVYENNNMNGVIILSDYNTDWGQGKPWPGGQGMLFTKTDHEHKFD
jgi:carbamoyltransferase